MSAVSCPFLADQLVQTNRTISISSPNVANQKSTQSSRIVPTNKFCSSKKKYHQLIRSTHPDKTNNIDSSEFRKVREAFVYLEKVKNRIEENEENDELSIERVFEEQEVDTDEDLYFQSEPPSQDVTFDIAEYSNGSSSSSASESESSSEEEISLTSFSSTTTLSTVNSSFEAPTSSSHASTGSNHSSSDLESSVGSIEIIRANRRFRQNEWDTDAESDDVFKTDQHQLEREHGDMELDEQESMELHGVGDEFSAIGVELHRNGEIDENENMELDDDGEAPNEQLRDDSNPFGFKLNKDSRKRLCRKSKFDYVFGPKDAYICLERMFRVNGVSVVHKLFAKRIFVTTTQESNFFRIDAGRNVYIGISEAWEKVPELQKTPTRQYEKRLKEDDEELTLGS